MNITDRLMSWARQGMPVGSPMPTKAAPSSSNTPSLPVPLTLEWRRAQFSNPNYRAMCTEGVRANAIVFNCIEAHVFAYPEARLKVYKETSNGLEHLPNHPLQLLLNRPNPQMSQAEMLQLIALYKPVGGNCYLYKVRSNSGKPVELIPLNDSQITPVAGADLPISHYLWRNETTGKDEVVPANDIVHLKWLPDPLAPWTGLAPLVAVAREVDTDNEARRYIFNLLKNDAVPRAVVVAPPGTPPFDREERTRLENLLMDKYGGDNRGRMAVLGGLDIKRIGLDLQEMAADALSRLPEARIAGALRVPPVLAFLNVGLEQMTYNNVGGMRKQFTEGTIVPLWRMDADEIGADLLPEFGSSEGLVVAFDTRNVVALQENQAELRTWANDALSRGGITRNQYLAYLGLPPDSNGDVYLMPMSLQEVPSGTVSGTKAVSILPRETKAKADRRKAMQSVIAAQRQNRLDVAGRMEGALDNYFGGLADRVIHRALTSNQPKSAKGLMDWEQLLFDSDSAELEVIIKRFYVELLQLSWDNWNVELGVTKAFDLQDPAVTEALSGAGARVKQIQEVTRQAIQDALQNGASRGWSIDHIVRGDATEGVSGLRDMIQETYKGRSKTISITELSNAQATAATTRYKNAGVDRVLVMDGGFPDSDEACNALNDKIMSLEWAQAHPIAHPRCLIGETKVLAADVSTAYSRPFDGEVVVLRTSGNHDLTCTPNHPILTDHGWVAADLLRKGDKVVCGVGGQGASLLGLRPNDDDMIPAIKELADSFRKSSGMTSAVVPGTPKDFHGDGSEGDVNVVFVNRFMKDGVNPSVNEHGHELALRFRDVGRGDLVSQCFSNEPLVTIPFVSSCDMSSGGDLLSPRIGPLLVNKFRLLTQRSSNSESAKPFSDCRSMASNDLPNGGATQSLVNIHVDQQIIAGPLLSEPEDKSSLVQRMMQLITTEADALSECVEVFPGLIALEDIVEISRESFSGHVYNLSTATEWYFANGIITHNCHRAIGAAFPDDGPIDEEAHQAWLDAGGDSAQIGGKA